MAIRKNLQKPLIDQSEIGTSGHFVVGGQVQSEYLPELRGEKGLKVFTQMHQSEGLCKAQIKAISLPLLNATWYIDPSDPEDPEAVLLAKKVENNLIHGMSSPWRWFLFQAILSEVYGFYIFEHVWKLEENPGEEEFAVQIEKFAPRHPLTIKKWIHDQDGKLMFIEQQARFNYGESSVVKPVRIPYEKCLHFINEPEAGNYTGISMFRAQYKHWKISGNIEGIEDIGAEKMALGVLVVKPPPNYATLKPHQQEKIDAIAADIIEAYRVNPNAGIYAPYGMTIEIVEGKMNSQALDKTINRHRNSMAQSSLTGFLMLTEGGSFALSKDKTTFFLQALAGIANNICDTVSSGSIKPLVLKNDRTVKKFPRLAVKNILFQQDEMKKQDEEDTKEENEQLDNQTAIDETGKTVKVKSTKKEGFTERKKLKKHIHFSENPITDRVNFDAIKRQKSETEETLQNKIKEITKKQIKAIRDQLTEGKTISKVIVPHMEEVQQAWQDSLTKTELLSINHVEQEFNRPSNVSREKVKTDIENKAALMALKHKSDLLVEISNYQMGAKK